MKKLVLMGLALVAGAVMVQAQGTISIQVGAGTVYTNTGTVSGVAKGQSYDYELLDMTQAKYTGLTAQQQAGVYSLGMNQADFSLWTDAGISGVNAGSLTAGGINGQGAVGGAAANNWAAPTSADITTAGIDYYTVIGWSATLGNWATVSAELAAGTFTTGANQFFGQTLTAYNYSGGGPNSLAAVNAFSTSGATGLAGSGMSSIPGSLVLNVVSVPEPATLALAGLGGISMLFLRRRKS
jgi:hypothetical protein